MAPSGGDRASGSPSHAVRPDAPLYGAIQLTVPVEHENLSVLTRALKETGAFAVERF